jgi:predicted histone-like DNA-binding protein
MSIKLKKLQRINPQNLEDDRKWYLVQERSGSVGLAEIAKEIADRSSLTFGDVQNVLRNLLEVLPTYIRLGQTIHLEGFGSFHISVTSNGKATPEELTVHDVRNTRLIFTPSVEMKKSIEGLSFEIEHSSPTP